MTNPTDPQPAAIAYALQALADAIRESGTVHYDDSIHSLTRVILLEYETATRDALLSGMTDITPDTYLTRRGWSTAWTGRLLTMSLRICWEHPSTPDQPAVECMAPEPYGPVPLGVLADLRAPMLVQDTRTCMYPHGEDDGEHDHEMCRDVVDEAAAAAAEVPAGRVDTWPATSWPPHTTPRIPRQFERDPAWSQHFAPRADVVADLRRAVS